MIVLSEGCDLCYSLLKVLRQGEHYLEDVGLGNMGGSIADHLSTKYLRGKCLSWLHLSYIDLIMKTPFYERFATLADLVVDVSAAAQVVVEVWKVVTWLILPVVICLSQRLSHACLSINKFVL